MTKAERDDYRGDKRYLRDVNASLRKNPLPLYAVAPERERGYTRAGYGYKRPKRVWRETGNGTVYAVALATAFLAWIFWMAYTPSGNAFAETVSRFLFGV